MRRVCVDFSAPRPSAWRVRGTFLPLHCVSAAARRFSSQDMLCAMCPSGRGRAGPLARLPHKKSIIRTYRFGVYIVPGFRAYRCHPEGPCAPAQPQDTPRPAGAGRASPGGDPRGPPHPAARPGPPPGTRARRRSGGPYLIRTPWDWTGPGNTLYAPCFGTEKFYAFSTHLAPGAEKSTQTLRAREESALSPA